MKVTAALAILALVGVVTVCADSAEGGFGLPTLAPDLQNSVLVESGALPTTVVGTVEVESNGCFTIRDAEGNGRAWVVWPDTASQDDDVVVLASGDRIGQGAGIEASGAFLSLDDLPDGNESQSYFGSFGRFCDADTRGVLMLSEVRP